jgi:hypothetical protein
MYHNIKYDMHCNYDGSLSTTIVWLQATHVACGVEVPAEKKLLQFGDKDRVSGFNYKGCCGAYATYCITKCSPVDGHQDSRIGDPEVT